MIKNKIIKISKNVHTSFKVKLLSWRFWKYLNQHICICYTFLTIKLWVPSNLYRCYKVSEFFLHNFENSVYLFKHEQHFLILTYPFSLTTKTLSQLPNKKPQDYFKHLAIFLRSLIIMWLKCFYCLWNISKLWSFFSDRPQATWYMN